MAGRLELEEKVKQIIAEQLGVGTEEIRPESLLVDDLGADSLDEVELLMAFEEEFVLDLGDDDEQFQDLTFKEIMDLLEKHIGTRPSA
jgi:acyl carrier protein